MGSLVQQRQLAAVTGASSGIGYELARQFARHGYDLLICSHEPRIHETAAELEGEGVHVHAVQADLRTYEGVESLYREIKHRGRPLDAIAINAGIGVGADFTRETELDDELALIQLNVTSVVHLAKRVAWDMVEHGSGRILITASTVASMPAPLEAVFAASRAFDLSFAESLRKELADTGVTVTALLPGPTDTEFFEHAGLGNSQSAEIAAENDPADVAKQGFDALIAGRERVYAATNVLPEVSGARLRHCVAPERS